MDAGARTVDISVREVSLMVEERRQPEKCIVVRDDGWGMTANEIKLCLGLGYSMHKSDCPLFTRYDPLIPLVTSAHHPFQPF